MASRPSDRYPALSVSVEPGQRQPTGHFQHQPRSPYNHLAVRSPGPRSPPGSPPGSPPFRTPRPFPQFQQNQPRPIHPSAFSQVHAQQQPRPYSHQYPNRSPHPQRPPLLHGTTAPGYPPARPYVHSAVLTENYPSTPAPVFSSHSVVIPSRNSSTYNPSTAVSSPPRSLSNSSGAGSASSTATIVSPLGPIAYRPGPPSQQQRQQRPHWTPSSATLDPTTDHPLALGPPNPRFAQQSGPDYRQVRPRIQQQPASRPGSVSSNFSTRSNEPLHQSPRGSPSPARGFSSRKSSNMTSSSKSTKVASAAGGSYRGNHLDLPEHRTKAGPATITRERRSSTSSSTHSSDSTRSRTGKAMKNKAKGRTLSRLGRIFRGPQPYNPDKYKMTSMGKMAQFSNERLYLHWIRFGVLQGSIAVLLLSFGIGVASYVGVGAIILALLTLIYSTTLYHTRHLNMVNKRKDVKYFARAIPTLLTLGLLVLYGWNFVVMVTYPKETWIPPPWTQYDDGNFMNYF
ncbi:hypothetical protein BGZ72_000765 [Mortierella alpina]|nr:hypothetical protein BGZ72_000765 [Mortierella alpina]